MKKEIEQALKDLEEIEIHITKRLEKGGIIKVGEMIICEQVNTIKFYIEELEEDCDKSITLLYERLDKERNKLKRIEEVLNKITKLMEIYGIKREYAIELHKIKSILEEGVDQDESNQ